jgi:hypothetical protein
MERNGGRTEGLPSSTRTGKPSQHRGPATRRNLALDTHTHLWPTDRPRALAPWDRRCGQERAGAGPCPHRTPIHGRKRLADVCHSGAAAGCSCQRDPTRGRARASGRDAAALCLSPLTVSAAACNAYGWCRVVGVAKPEARQERKKEHSLWHPTPT